MIKDSGKRREFETGAVRDIQEGKGRCDLLPLELVSKALCGDKILYYLNDFKHGYDGALEEAIYTFISRHRWTVAEAMLELAKHFEEGAKKYGEDNWQKGIPAHCYLDSAIRHYLKYLDQQEDEPHDRAFLWNLFCLRWTLDNKPELNDIHTDQKPKRIFADDDGEKDVNIFITEDIVSKNAKPFHTMTEREAIQRLKERNFNDVEAIDMVIDLASKRLDEKPIKHTEGLTMSDYAYICPTCKHSINDLDRICDNCGQCLTWQEV